MTKVKKIFKSEQCARYILMYTFLFFQENQSLSAFSLSPGSPELGLEEISLEAMPAPGSALQDCFAEDFNFRDSIGHELDKTDIAQGSNPCQVPAREILEAEANPAPDTVQADRQLDSEVTNICSTKVMEPEDPAFSDNHSDYETTTQQSFQTQEMVHSVISKELLKSDNHNELEATDLAQSDQQINNCLPDQEKSSYASGQVQSSVSAKEKDDVTIPCLLCSFKTTHTSLLHTHIVTSHSDIFVIKVRIFTLTTLP